MPENQHTERKLLNFESWCSGEVLKSAKISWKNNNLTIRTEMFGEVALVFPAACCLRQIQAGKFKFSLHFTGC